MKTFICAMIIFISGAAFAEDLTLKEKAKQDDKLTEGLTKNFKLISNFSLKSSDQVVGLLDGDTIVLGVKVENGLIYKKGNSEWRNTLNYDGGITKTPSLPRYVKSSDELGYETIYLRATESRPWLGPYLRASVQSPIFVGEDIRSDAVEYFDISNNNSLGTGTSHRLTDPFTPITTRESIGLFAKAIDRKNTQLEFRLGGGALQLQAKDQLRLADDDKTARIELVEIEEIHQVGVEYGVFFKGKWNEESTYSLSIDLLTPLGEDIKLGKECDDCSDMQLTNVDIKASVGTKLNGWVTLVYEYKALKQPQVLDKFQIQHGIVLNISYTGY